MAECHELFIKFNEEIKLSAQKKEILRKSRNAIRKDIKEYFKEILDVSSPKFWGQGSYMMNTIITPIEGEYDIDDGVYLTHLSNKEETDWPSATTVHNWIANAVKDKTSTPAKDKNTCVRVIYKGDYHIDLPIYIKADNADCPKLAHKNKGWIDSDPKKLTNWFDEQVDEKGVQLKQIVRYFKAWKDFKSTDGKFPSGMIFTILVSEHFVDSYESVEDAAFIATAQAIYEELSENFSLKRPVYPYEELLDEWSEESIAGFLEKLSSLITNGQKALEAEGEEEASKIWIKIFGDRFPKSTPPNEKNRTEKGYAIQTDKPAVLGNYGRSS